MKPEPDLDKSDSYRVFISYSREDLELVKKIVKILESNGLTPMWDKNFRYGHGFHEQIKTFISHAHVFLPVITKTSSERGWVHQEIGYAMGLNVPVLPVTLGVLPGEMIRELHAVKLSEDLMDLEAQLSREVFNNLINRYRETPFALFQCADLSEDRARMMAKYANDVLELGSYGCVRQKGALSSFSLPKNITSHPIWKQRMDPIIRSPFHSNLLRDERIALEKHAQVNGCRLIIDPNITYEIYSDKAKIVRLNTLVEFLDSMSDKNAQVAIHSEMHSKYNLTIVGDWFSAESVSAVIGQGYQQTIFTRHAPSMRNRIELFDEELKEHLEALGWTAESSRGEAIKTIKNIIHDLESG